MNTRNQWPTLLVLAGLAAVLLAGWGSVAGGGWLSEAPSVTVGMSDDVVATDPASGYDPGSWLLFNNVFQSLLRFPDGGTVPEADAAEKCAFTDDHARVYRCVLKDGLRFSNGDRLTARDVKFSFDRTRTINDPSGPAIMFQTLKSIRAPDDRTIVFDLKTSDATFPSKIASGAGSIVDHRQYDAHGLRADGRAVGSGPYTLESFDEDRAVFAVNSHYEGTDKVKNSGVTLRFFHGDRSALKRAVTGGEVDIAYRGLSAGDMADIDKEGGRQGLDVVEGSSAEVQHLVFNMNDPVAGKLGVRRAIAFLLDRESLVDKVYQGTAIPLYSIIPAGISGHDTAFFDHYADGLSRPRAAAALRADGFVGKVRLTLWSTPSRYGPATDEELRVIAKQLNASDLFEADVRSVPFNRYEKDIAVGRYGVYVKGWVPDYPDADNFTAPFFGPGNVLDNNYTNHTITDTLLPATAAQTDRGAAAGEFEQLQDIVAEQVPILPVWQGKQYAVVRDDVHGVEYCLDSTTVFRFWKLSKS
ncbi:ABC transporter substrate-binding protein [Streptomyces sp. NPDC018057]|uniref:ABC transporter substrate-binding protein n=1 Tax=unclassified Streptomyces TaxID=2593676 RepID=UPI00379C02C8